MSKFIEYTLNLVLPKNKIAQKNKPKNGEKNLEKLCPLDQSQSMMRRLLTIATSFLLYPFVRACTRASVHPCVRASVHCSLQHSLLCIYLREENDTQCGRVAFKLVRERMRGNSIHSLRYWDYFKNFVWTHLPADSKF